ncbi:hypothetical protein DUNSADRAFT_9139 [Dunaliella salina]|uniref:MYND-type domain-containing protein n=1 Tax=Dunaliella salina TaxID=3046 RepID=A0ABQ7GI34_DUNSA|nr:hypothetical protein DUNSADRAFT_9139 [Dunaliella salina]|eukprot:KAF5834273.1 hypothetical protein DUNSADRAFT_9139 [Dunaliella salina]
MLCCTGMRRMMRQNWVQGAQPRQMGGRARCIDAMERQCEGLPTNFKCVLFEWKATEKARPCPCKKCGPGSNVGSLVFVDEELQRFIVMECENGKRPASMLKDHAEHMANTLFNVAYYIGIWPKWVRSCYFEAGDKDLPQGIGDPACKKSKSSGFGEVTSRHFVGILNEKHHQYRYQSSDVDRLKQKEGHPGKPLPHISPLDSILKFLENPNLLEDAMGIMAGKAAQAAVDVCEKCGRTAEQAEVPKLQRCGRCKVAQYCSGECQVADLKSHKLHCQASTSSWQLLHRLSKAALPSQHQLLTAFA